MLRVGPAAGSDQHRTIRVYALMKYGRDAASTRQRLLQFTPYLAEHGVEVEWSPLLGDDYVRAFARGERSGISVVARRYSRRFRQLLSLRQYDIIWVYLETFPYLPGWIEQLVFLSGRPVVYDFDDAIFYQYDLARNGAVRKLLGNKIVPLVRRACVAIAGNQFLADYAERNGGRPVIIPTVVDTDCYVPAASRKAGPLTVGWIGSPSTWTYVQPLLPTLLPVLKRHGARFLAIGAGRQAMGIAGVDALDWSEESEVAGIQAMDIGIMPLADTPWARGKCGYKLIQYMACGVPAIGSPVGVNADIVIDGVTGLLADTPEDWQRSLDQLLTDETMRRNMGRHGRDRAVDLYSLGAQAPRLLAALTGCLAAKVDA
jgi:glycosyltransferase involved in cell wall biosynthesis